MIRTFYSKAAVGIVACLFLFITSCVQEEYRISEETLNLEVTVFQDGVSLPLGSTDKIMVSQLLNQLDPEIKDMFPAGEDGAYAFGMTDNFDFSEDLAFLSENFAIDAFSVNENMPFDLSSVDVTGVKIDEIEVGVEENLSDVIEPVDFKLDPIRPDPFYQVTDISSYIPEDEELQVDINEYAYSGKIATINDVEIPYETYAFQYALQYVHMTAEDEYPLENVVDFLNTNGKSFDIDLGYEQLENFTFGEPISVPLNISLPEMIKSVENIHLHEGAQVRITVDLSDELFFTSGAIVPHLDLDIHEIFHLTKEENDKHPHPDSPLEIDHIIGDFVLSHESVDPNDPDNSYYASNTYDIESLVIDYENDFKTVGGCQVLDKNITINPVLTLSYDDLKTSIRRLDEYPGGDVTMSVKVEFLNFQVDDVAVTVDPVETVVETTFPLNVRQQLPEMVRGVQEVSFAEGSGVDIAISVENVDRIEGLDLSIDHLKMTFPEGIEVEGTDAENVLILPIGSLHDGLNNQSINITGINLGDAVLEDDKYFVEFNGEVKVEAVAQVSVKEGESIHTKDLPKSEDQDITLGVDVVAEFEIDDFKVDFEGYYYEVEQEEVIEFEVGKEVADLGKVLIYPETTEGLDPIITIDVELPETQLHIGPSEEGLVIDMPDMLIFKDLSPDILPYYSSEGNILTFKGELPRHIELPIDHIMAEATAKTVVKDGEEKEIYVVADKFTVKGNVGVAPGIVMKGDVDALTAPDAVVSFKAFVPEMKPSIVNIDSYQAVIEGEPISFGDGIDLSSLPEQLVSVGEILLSDVFLTIDIKAPGIDNLLKDADVQLNMEVSLPDAIMLPEDVVDSDNVLHVNGKLENEQIVVEPIQIFGLKLDKTAEELEEYMKNMQISYNGSVTITDASIDMGAFEDADLNLDVNVNLSSADSEKIEIAKVTGKIDYQIDPVSTEVDLSSLTEMMNSETLNATLDLNRFSLALELTTNLSVPLLADLSIIPYKDGEVIEGKTLSQDITIAMPESDGEPNLIRYWISNYPLGEDPYMPEGYKHIQLDILSLIALTPEKLQIALNAGTDPEKECSLAPSEEGYVLEAAYAFNLPFEFGEKTMLEFHQAIEDLPSELATVLQYGSLGLAGNIESSLPFELELTYQFLDSEGNVLEIADEASHQIIKPGTLTGEPVKTDLNLIVGIQEGADISDIYAIDLLFKAKALPGAPIKESSYVQASLQALIPKGITLDLGQLLGGNDVEDTDVEY